MKRALALAGLLVLAGCNSHHGEVDHPTYTYDSHHHRHVVHHYVHVTHTHVIKKKH